MNSKVCPYESPASFENLARKTRNKHGFNYQYDIEQPTNPVTGNRLSDSVVSFIAESVGYSIRSHELCGYWPNLEKTEQGLFIKLWQTAKDRERGFNKRVAMKPGKALRHMFPFAPETWIDSTVTKFKERFTDGVFTVKTTDSFDGFNEVYSLPVAPYKNPETTALRKSLASSCMRHDSDHFGTECHPCAVYGSGDFTLVYALDGQGRLAGRSILHKKSNTCGPIYGVCEASIDAIRDKLKAMDADSAKDGAWIGARLVRIESFEGLVGPYIDVEPRALSDNGDWLVISRYGDIDASEVSGTLGESGVECCACGCRVSEEDLYSDDNGECYCESCYCETFTTCEHCHDVVRHEDTQMVHVVGYRGRHYQETWCDHCVNTDAVTCEDGELWQTGDCAITANGDWLSPDDMESGEWTVCEDDSEWYSTEETGQTEDGVTYRREYLNDNGYTYSESSGLWERPENEEPENEKAA